MANGEPKKSVFETAGGVAVDVLKGLGLLAASAAIPGFGEGYVQAQQRQQMLYEQAKQNLQNDLRQAPRMALNPGVQKDIKRFFGDDALQQFIAEAQRVSAAEAFINSVIGGAAETTFLNELSGATPPAFGVGVPTGATPSPAPTVQPPTPTVAPTAAPVPAARRRRRTAATALQEQLEPGQTVSIRSNGINVTIKGLTPDERAAVEFDNLLNEIVDANPGVTPEEAIRTAARASVGRIGFGGLPDEVRTILTTGTIQDIQQFVQSRYERIRAKEQTIGERAGRLEQPLANEELIGSVVQSELDRVNAILAEHGAPPLNAQAAANYRLDATRALQRSMAEEKARATARGTIGAPLPAAGPEVNIRPLSPKDSEFFSGASGQMEAWVDTLRLFETEAQKFGPLSGRFHNLAEAYGLESPEFTRVQAGLKRMVQQAIRMMEGARATEQDRQFTLDLFPKPTDPPPKLIGSTVTALKETIRLVQARERQLNAEGFRVPPVKVPPEVQSFIDRHTAAQSLDAVRNEIKRAK